MRVKCYMNTNNNSNNNLEQIMTLQEVSEYLKIKERTIYGWVTCGKIPAFKLGNAWRFRRSELEEWIDKKRNVGVI